MPTVLIRSLIDFVLKPVFYIRNIILQLKHALHKLLALNISHIGIPNLIEFVKIIGVQNQFLMSCGTPLAYNKLWKVRNSIPTHSLF